MNVIEHLEENKWIKPDHYAGFNPEGDYLIYSKTRDSSILENVNFDRILEELEKLENPEGDKKVYTFSASHWACGWIEYLLVDKNADESILQSAGEIICGLSDYPVFDESAYSEAQYEAIHDYWEKLDLQERIDYCKKADVSIFASRDPEVIPEGIEQILYDEIY